MAVVVVVALVAGTVILTQVTGGTRAQDLSLADRTLADGDEFLEQVEAEWRSELPVSGVTMSASPACYFLVDQGTTELTGHVACGGVRRPDAGPQEVWDVYGYETVPAAEDSLRATSPDLRDSGVHMGSYDFVGVDGAEPGGDVTSLAKPPLPSVDSDFLRSVTGTLSELSTSPTDVSEPGELGRIITPGGDLEVRRVGSAESVRASIDGETQAAQAPRGSRLYVVEFVVTARGDSDDTALQVFLENQGTTRQVYAADSSMYGTETDQKAMVFAAPAADMPRLLVASAGHEQAIDLATGRRQPDPVTDTYYRTVTEQDLSSDVLTGEYSEMIDGDRARGTFTTRLTSAEVLPHLRSHGWARPGRAWLVLRFDELWSSPTDDTGESAHHTWTVKTDTGQTLTQDVTTALDSYGTVEGSAVIDVPTDASKFTVSTTARVTYEPWLGLTEQEFDADTTTPVTVTLTR